LLKRYAYIDRRKKMYDRYEVMKAYNERKISKGEMYCCLVSECSLCHKCHVEDVTERSTYYDPMDKNTYYSDKEEFGPGDKKNIVGQLKLEL
jgi:hypothetical protein